MHQHLRFALGLQAVEHPLHPSGLPGDVVNEDTLGFLTSIGNPHIAKPFSLVSVKKVVAEVIRGNAPALAGSPA